ncbi:MAG TPA: hypothetical protein VG844_11840 [Terracidiphilus sp.]|nr:hypothetical protein [Terracidiphilus sp.]
MNSRWNIYSLDVERLLKDWRWLCPQPLKLVDRNAFGDLFLVDEAGEVFLLDVGRGSFSPIATSIDEFNKQICNLATRVGWFEEEAASQAAQRGLVPGPTQCIGFPTPAVFAEGGNLNTAYIADIYDHLGFLGDIHRQIADLPDGSKVQLVVRHSSEKT